MKGDYVFTSESVTLGHPDKLCDQVSDAIVDTFLKGDPSSSIVAECALSSGVMFISAHYTSQTIFDIQGVARDVIRAVGYSPEAFNADDCTILTSFKNHTATDYRPMDLDELDNTQLDRITAKHPATLFGYACDQTKVLMPLPIWLAHRLADHLDSPAVKKKLPYLLPDGKAQVAIEYVDGKAERIHSIALVTSQTDASAVDLNQLRGDMIEHVIEPVLKQQKFAADKRTNIFVNPEGLQIGGGPAVHSGLTGRKTGIDTYGEYARHSGAALSGKDPMRIDRVGAYAARYAAKNVVAAGLATECEVQLSYTVGAARPISLHVRTFGTGTVDDKELASRLDKAIDFRLGAIVRDLRLQKLPAEIEGFYRKLAVYGQMGRVDLKAPWEKTDKVKELT
ncbi:MAG: methionine adenosyltransferase [Sedimenticolaceae bacterium]